MRPISWAKSLAAAAFLVLAVPGLAEARDGVILYRDVGFGGGSVRIDRDISDLSAIGVNDAASSISVRGGRWQVCEHANYRGRCAIIERDVADFRKLDLNDKISSIRRVDDRGGYGDGYDRPDRRAGLIAFRDIHFNGGDVRIDRDVPDLRKLGINDQISSIRVGSGVWLVCEDIYFGGRCITLDRDAPDLTRIDFNDRISSIRRLR